MQLKGIHYLIILIGALLLWYIYSLGKVVKEGFDDFVLAEFETLLPPSSDDQRKDINDFNEMPNDKDKDIVGGFIDKVFRTHDDNKLSSTKPPMIGPYGPAQQPQQSQPQPQPQQQQQQQYSENNNVDGSLGIPYSKIPRGQEDLYILKSQIVPPNCPICPSVIGCPSKNPPPPCPPCARCPEPSYDCKLVPNYNNTKDGVNNSKLPIPILTDFSQFGM